MNHNADTTYRVEIPNKLWMQRGYTMINNLAESIGRENYTLQFRKNKKNQVVPGRPVTIVFTNQEHYVWFRMSF
jgi:hypothetical protein